MARYNALQLEKLEKLGFDPAEIPCRRLKLMRMAMLKFGPADWTKIEAYNQPEEFIADCPVVSVGKGCESIILPNGFFMVVPKKGQNS